MKYTLFEDPLTQKFAFLPLPRRFVDGDPLPILAADRWFDNRADAIAALPDLLTREEPEAGPDDAAQPPSP